MSIKRLSALILPVLFVGTVFAQTSQTYCEISLRNCPEAYDGDTLVVPLSVVSLSAKIMACETEVFDTTRGDPPAIMFIIDNTSSMASSPGNDRNGNRFRVARAIIDSVYKNVPNAQVGMVVFDAGLFLNSARVTDPNLVDFKGMPYYKPDSTVERYMPLLTLNQPAQAGGFVAAAAGTTPTAIDLYRRMLVDGGATGNSGIRNPAGGGTLGGGSGTNVTSAFEAALEQFATTNIAPKNQYIIFISDGRYEMSTGLIYGGCNDVAVAIPSVGGGLYGNSARYPKQRDFMAGQIGGQSIPTTYTVFLNTDEPDVMAQNRATLDTMTAAIKTNRYSDNNNSSDIWTADGNQYDALLELMMDKMIMDKIVNNFLTKTQVKAKKVIITSAGITESSETIEDGYFTPFNRFLPIDTGNVASVRMAMKYSVQVDTVNENGDPWTYWDEIGAEYQFWIRRSNSSDTASWGAGWNLVNCGDVISVLAPNRVIPQSQPAEEAAAIAPAVILSGEFTAGPNPVSKSSGIVNFYRQGRRVANCELRIYDATGNVISKVKIHDNVIGSQSRRKAGAWDLADKNGKQVSDGTYLVKGVLKMSDGKSEKVSVILGVR